MKRSVNAVLFQGIWFACIFGGNVWAILVTIVYLFIHDRYFMKTRREWWLLVTFIILGFIIDGTLFQLGIFSRGELSITMMAPPIWLLCLWCSTATLFAHSLSFLRSRYLLSALMGMIGPTMSYFAGAKIAGITLAEPMFISLAIVAIIWAMVLPFGVWLTEKWALFEY